VAQTTPTTEWRTGWDVQNPIDIPTRFVSRDEGDWAPGRERGLLERDLHLADGTDGRLGARHIRLADGADGSSDWQFHDLDFQWFFVLKGSVKLRTEDGHDVTLREGDSAYQPPYWRYQRSEVSSDFEAVEVTAPAVFETVTGQDARKPERAAEFAHLAPSYVYESPESWTRGNGPRSYALYRDLRTSEPTDGRVHMHLIRVDLTEPPPEGGTGDHTHTMAQWFMPIRGWLDLTADGQPERRCVPGDFYMVGNGVTHNAVLASEDYTTLEMCVPAEYETTAAR
jgi:quercetin dioxygenase-like cupin family protein